MTRMGVAHSGLSLQAAGRLVGSFLSARIDGPAARHNNDVAAAVLWCIRAGPDLRVCPAANQKPRQEVVPGLIYCNLVIRDLVNHADA